MSYLDGKAIYSVEYYKSPIATVGNTERITLHIPGGTITVSNTDEVHKILKWMRQATSGNFDVNEYVRFMMIEEGML